jgi:hypothetical protein
MGTRSMIGIPCSTIASCFMLELNAQSIVEQCPLKVVILRHAQHSIDLLNAQPVEYL